MTLRNYLNNLQDFCLEFPHLLDEKVYNVGGREVLHLPTEIVIDKGRTKYLEKDDEGNKKGKGNGTLIC